MTCAVIERFAAVSAREQGLCGAVVLILCGYVFYAGIIEPQLMELRATEANFSAKQTLLAEKERAASAQAGEEETLAGLQQRIEQSDTGLFSPREAATFLAGLHTLTESAKCQMTSIDFLGDETLERPQKKEETATVSVEVSGKNGTEQEPEAEKPKNLVKATARLSLRGTYPNVVKLFAAITERPQIVDISEVTLELVSQDASDLMANFVVSLFSIEQEEVAR